MIVTENIIINGKEYVKTYSDQDFYIKRDGMIFESAIDPSELGRTYEETLDPIIHFEDLRMEGV